MLGKLPTPPGGHGHADDQERLDEKRAWKRQRHVERPGDDPHLSRPQDPGGKDQGGQHNGRG